MKERICPTCAGSGQTPIFDQDGYLTQFQICPLCLGQGKVDEDMFSDKEGCLGLLLIVISIEVTMIEILSHYLS
ncbi:MAG: hypothetical protein AAF433_22405 [Bacteroidota bacterium]